MLARSDDCDEVHLVLDGLVIDYTATSAGRRVIVGLAGAGGVAGLSGSRGCCRYSTATLSDAHVFSVPATPLRGLMLSHPRIASNFTSLVLDCLERREQQVAAMAHSDACSKLAMELLGLTRHLGSREPSGDVRIPRLSHQVLADLVGLRRESLTHGLSHLSAAGAIALRGRQILVHPVQLTRLLGGSNAPWRQVATA